MRAKEQPLVIGGVPRVDLLPPSIRAAQRTKAVARMLVAVVVVVAIAVAAGVGFAFVRAFTSQAELQAERDRTNALLAEQMQYAEARDVASQVDGAKVALRLGTTTEIDWKASLDEINATLPGGLSLTSVVIDALSPAEVAPTAEMPLQEDWVASLTLSATSPTVPDVEAWLNNLEGITGFAGVAPPVNITEDEAGGYLVQIQVNVNDEAYALRFGEEG